MLGSQNIVIDAVYKPRLVKGGDVITENGLYYIAWFASGAIEIDKNLQVTLRGVNGGSAGFNNLSVYAGSGTELTIENTVLTGDRTLLEFGGGNTLIISGGNVISGTGELDSNVSPTVRVYDGLTVKGDGSLYISAGKNNSAIKASGFDPIIFDSGSVTVYKAELLGSEGGAVCANGTSVEINGGSFTGGQTATCQRNIRQKN
jgi:hypothetical protein